MHLLYAKNEALDKFGIRKNEYKLYCETFIKRQSNRAGEYYDPNFFQSIGTIHEITTPYTPQQNGVTERKS